MSIMSQFQLSRVYAKGWSAGRISQLDPASSALDAEISAANPYRLAEERGRWAEGFKDGLRRNEEIDGRRRRRTVFTKKNSKANTA